MLTLTGTGRLTRRPELRRTGSGKAVTTLAVACDRCNRKADPVYVELVLWEAQAEAAVQHLVKGQVIAFSGRFEPRRYETKDGDRRIALDVANVDLEYGSKPRNVDDANAPTEGDHDIPF
jgi:single-strand DNA-binding protein